MSSHMKFHKNENMNCHHCQNTASDHPWVSCGDSCVALLNVGDFQGCLRPFSFPMVHTLFHGEATYWCGFIPPTCWELKNLSSGKTSLWIPYLYTQLHPGGCLANPQTPESLHAPNETLQLLPRPAFSPEFHVSEVTPPSPPGQKPGRLPDPPHLSINVDILLVCFLLL